MFLLINNYQSEETMPYIVSAEKFASYDAAMQAAKKRCRRCNGERIHREVQR